MRGIRIPAFLWAVGPVEDFSKGVLQDEAALRKSREYSKCHKAEDALLPHMLYIVWRGQHDGS